MRILSLLTAVVALLPVTLLAQSQTVVTETGKTHFEAPCPSGTQLRLHVRSGGVRVLGTEDSKISVDVSAKNSWRINEVKYRLTQSSGSAELRVSGGPRSDFDVTIHVPRNSGLFVRVPAGDLTIQDVIGSKDVELHAGDLSISVGNAADYSSVDASVLAGDISASPFGESHGGLFRSFRKSGNGKFTLHAHVGAGDLTLN